MLLDFPLRLGLAEDVGAAQLRPRLPVAGGPNKTYLKLLITRRYWVEVYPQLRLGAVGSNPALLWWRQANGCQQDSQLLEVYADGTKSSHQIGFR